MGYIGNPLDPWGAADPATAYGAAFEAMAASGAYDVLVLVHDFPYRSLPSEVATANDVTVPAARGDRATGRDILPVYVSLTSGEPPPETKALLDDQGGGAPLLRGAVEAFTRDRVGRALGAPHAARRRATARGAPGWPALGRGPDVVRRRTPAGVAAAAPRRRATVAVRAREPGPSLRAGRDRR